MSRRALTVVAAGAFVLAVVLVLVIGSALQGQGRDPQAAAAAPTAAASAKPTPSATPTKERAGCQGDPDTPGGDDPWGGCWPGPQNTGYPHGLPGDTRPPVSLTAYTGPSTITECGAVIDSKIITGDLVVTVGNGTHDPATPCVTVQNSLVKGVIHTDERSFGPVVVRDTEVDVPGLSWWENIGRYNVFVWRVDSHGSEGVIKCANYCTADDSYVHGMRLGGEYHYNAFGSNGIEPDDGYFRIEHSWASCGDWASVDRKVGSDAGCSAAIGFYGDFAPIQGVVLHRNFLAGATISDDVPGAKYRQPGYCLNPGYYPGKPFPAPTRVRVTDNVFGRGDTSTCGMFGPANSLQASGRDRDNEWSGNRYADGHEIDRPEE